MSIALLADPSGLQGGYLSAEPFPHIVLDGLFPDSELEGVLSEFPPAEAPGWRSFDNAEEKKLGYDHRTSVVGPRIQGFMEFMNSWRMLEFLEKLTGIGGLIPDPYFGGGGPHQILPGGFLKVHTDFNWHPILQLDRRLNALVYLNREWKDEYGGHLELWDRDMKSCVQKILPVFNRTVVFSTTDFSYHGHPRPLTCPPGMSRKSVSFYYYSNGRPESERSKPHDTIFRET